MSTSREVVKYMALPYNGITAAIKWKNNDDMLRSDRGRYTAHGKECGAEGPAQRVRGGWERATYWCWLV